MTVTNIAQRTIFTCFIHCWHIEVRVRLTVGGWVRGRVRVGVREIGLGLETVRINYG